jgi:hypothetical protein
VTYEPDRTARKASQRPHLNLPGLFEQFGISLVVSTYQAGKAIVIRNDNGILNTHFRTFSKPVGIAADHNRLTIGGAGSASGFGSQPEL